MQLRRLAFLATATVCLFSTFSFAQSATPTADTFSNSGTPKQNYGSQGSLAVRSGSVSFLKFSLGTVPTGVSVNKATLRLYVDAIITGGKFDVYQLTTGWSEGTLTYNNAPPLGLSATNNSPITLTTASLNQFVLVSGSGS